MEPLLDRLGRPLETLRISITDRCNFRCVYCMPKEVFGRDYAFLERRELLTLEELARVVGIFAGLGVRTVRITGGEPLVRRNVEHLVELLAAIETREGDRLELALTTNGSLLTRKAEALAAAGLNRVTVSLDSLDDEAFRAMNDVDFPVQRVLEGIDAAVAAGLPVKVNAVVKRGANDGDVLALAEHFRGSGHVLRFIEYMDVGSSNGWRLEDVVSADEIVRRISERWPLEPVALERTSIGFRTPDGDVNGNLLEDEVAVLHPLDVVRRAGRVDGEPAAGDEYARSLAQDEFELLVVDVLDEIDRGNLVEALILPL